MHLENAVSSHAFKLYTKILDAKIPLEFFHQRKSFSTKNKETNQQST